MGRSATTLALWGNILGVRRRLDLQAIKARKVRESEPVVAADSLLSVTEVFVWQKSIKPVNPCCKKNTVAEIKRHMEDRHKVRAPRSSSNRSDLTFREGDTG